MGIRTTADMVKAVLLPGADYDLSVNPDLTRFIKIASLVVDKVVDCASDGSDALTTEEALELETWLAAHYYKSSDRQTKSETAGRASASYEGKTDMGLKGTTYGQAALDLDFSGCLAAVTGGAATGGVSWVGKTEAEELSYWERNT